MTKTPLIFLPGLLCDAALWAHQTEHLRDIADSVVMDLTQQESIKDMAAHVLNLAPQRFALVGLSMGGYVAQEVMRQAPDRVQKLALVNTSARPDTPETAERRKGLVEIAQLGKFRGVTPKLLPMLVHPDRLKDDALCQTVLSMAERTGREAFVRQQTAIMGRIDGRPSLAMIQAKTLVITGRQDALTPPEHAEEMVKAIPQAKLALLEDCGHLSPLEHPQAVTALLRMWLSYSV